MHWKVPGLHAPTNGPLPHEVPTLGSLVATSSSILPSQSLSMPSQISGPLPSSTRPSQSLSRPSHAISATGPWKLPHAPNTPAVQVWVPSLHVPTQTPVLT